MQYQKKVALALCASMMATVALLAGCGGSGGDTSASPTPFPTATATPSLSSFVSRSTVANYNRDALILSARVSDTAQIRTDLAQTINDDLARVRTQRSELAAIAPMESPRLHEVLVGIKADAPWGRNWRTGVLTTNDANLDALLTRFEAESVSHVAVGATSDIYKIRFGSPLNTAKAVEEIKASSDQIRYAEQNALIGAPDDVKLSINGAERVYTFTTGWGDCPSGCINQHFWRATIGADSNLTITEGGDPLSEKR